MLSSFRSDTRGRVALGPFEYRFAPSTAAIRLTRHVLANWLTLQPGIDTDALDDLLLACSELTTNAVEHCRADGGSVALRARVDGDAVVLEMEDDGPGFAWPVAHRMVDVLDDAEHGRGLFIVEALVDRLEVEASGDRTVVRTTKYGVLRRPDERNDAALSARFRTEDPRSPR